jgi:hypothetical protein
MLLHHTPLLGKSLAPTHEILYRSVEIPLDPKISSRAILFLLCYVVVVVVSSLLLFQDSFCSTSLC